MEKVVTKDTFLKTVEGIKKITEEIKQFTPIAEGELKSLSASEFVKKVCNGNIAFEIRKRNAKYGDILFQCSFYNRKYFDITNKQKTIEEHPGVEVNVVGISKFIIDCPYAGSSICKLRNFTYPESYKEKVRSL